MNEAGLELDGCWSLTPPPALAHRAAESLAIARAVFDLPEATKASCASPDTNYQVGWRRSTVASGNELEVWHLDCVDRAQVWPDAMAAEREALTQLLLGTRALAGRWLSDRLAGRWPVEGLAASLADGPFVLRLLRYRAADAAVRFASHTDGAIGTLFIGDSAPGLEFHVAGRGWVPVRPTPRRWVLAAGEMLSFLTRGRIQSVRHRVGNVPDDRWAAAIFLHPCPEFRLRPEQTAGAFFERFMSRYHTGSAR